jgi:hypothetical protein
VIQSRSRPRIAKAVSRRLPQHGLAMNHGGDKALVNHSGFAPLRAARTMGNYAATHERLRRHTAT